MDNLNNNTENICSFCKKQESDVRKVIVGPYGSNICDHCLDIGIQILKETESKTNSEIAELTPAQLKEKLDSFIVGQDDAKRVLSVAVYNHYKRVRHNTHKPIKGKNEELEIEKSNVLMLGPTGSGKTLIARTLAKILNVPFAVADATTLTEAGYVGEDVENILLRLIQAADYDAKKAEYGIIYIDEVDKIARKSENVSITRDVSGEGVQQALLKIIESTVANVPPQGGRKHPQQECIPIDTTNILFIIGGAFVGLDKIIEKRKSSASIGFSGNVTSSKQTNSNALLKDIQPQDLIKFGLIPELVGRVPITVSLEELDESALCKILTTPQNALVKQYQKLFSLDNVELEFEDEAVRAVARRAIELKTGARGLRTILENLMLDYMYDLPNDTTVKKIVITKAAVEKTAKARIIKRPEGEKPEPCKKEKYSFTDPAEKAC